MSVIIEIAQWLVLAWLIIALGIYLTNYGEFSSIIKRFGAVEAVQEFNPRIAKKMVGRKDLTPPKEFHYFMITSSLRWPILLAQHVSQGIILWFKN